MALRPAAVTRRLSICASKASTVAAATRARDFAKRPLARQIKRHQGKIAPSIILRGGTLLQCRGQARVRPRMSAGWGVAGRIPPPSTVCASSWVEVVSGKHQVELLLGEVGIGDRQRDGMKGQVPGGVPGVFPLVRHRNDVVIDHVEPVAVPEDTARGVKGVGPVLLEPGIGVEVIELLGPQHAGEGLAHDMGRIERHRRGRQRLIKVVGLNLSYPDAGIESREVIGGLPRPGTRQAQPDDLCTPQP